MANLEREIDGLFALPLDEFTSARNELARRLKREGDKEAAEQVQELAKPSVPAWAINQLARHEKPAVKQLLDAGQKLRKAQERALSGGHSEALRTAQSEERQAVRDLTRKAERILEQAGRTAGKAILERVSATLGAAAVTEPARSALKAGRLTGELKASGFDALAGLEVPAQQSGKPRDELGERRQQKAERERRLRRQLEKAAREAEERAQAAERKAERAEEAAAEARERAEEERRAADAAASELAEFES